MSGSHGPPPLFFVSRYLQKLSDYPQSINVLLTRTSLITPISGYSGEQNIYLLLLGSLSQPGNLSREL